MIMKSDSHYEISFFKELGIKPLFFKHNVEHYFTYYQILMDFKDTNNREALIYLSYLIYKTQDVDASMSYLVNIERFMVNNTHKNQINFFNNRNTTKIA